MPIQNVSRGMDDFRFPKMTAAPYLQAGKQEDAVTAPVKEKKQRKRSQEKTRHVPLYNVVLLDDDDHSYAYVVEMLCKLFGHSSVKAFQMACEVDFTGRVIVDTTHRERAEMKRDQIHAYGADWRIPHCQGSMSAIIEPVGSES